MRAGRSKKKILKKIYKEKSLRKEMEIINQNIQENNMKIEELKGK